MDDIEIERERRHREREEARDRLETQAASIALDVARILDDGDELPYTDGCSHMISGDGSLSVTVRFKAGKWEGTDGQR